MNKVIRDGQVAVLYSPGWGAGWYTWNREHPEILFDPTIVSLVEEKKFDHLATYMILKYPDIYTGGMEDLTIAWIPKGTLFEVTEHDGSESIKIKENNTWIEA